MHMTRHGAISLKYHTLVEVLTQVAESVYAHGFKKLLLLNGHGGNISAVGAMRMILAYELSCPPSVALFWAQLPSQPKPTKEHAGELETSYQLYLQPELVDKDSLFWTEGVFGDPSKATRERGERMIKDAVIDLVKILRDYHDDKLDDEWGWSKEVMVGRKEV
jgi:creatinine amidohydrolase